VSTAAKSATAAKTASPAASASIAPTIKAPANIPQYKGLQKTIFTTALRYQEIKLGTGAIAETGKLYKVYYTGYRAADGVKFDSTDDHPRQPLRDKDGKPVLGDDGKPKVGDPQPMPFVQGVGGTIPGFDQAFVGMKIGGKRRIFIPWQLAYATRAIPDHGPGHPGIPAKSDLIFDVELVDVSDPPPPQPQGRPGMGALPGRAMPNPNAPRPTPGATPGTAPGQPGSTAAPTAAPAPGTAPTPTAAPAPGSAPTATPAPSSSAPATTPPPSGSTKPNN
jgi:peptidylprolyl isomerase